MALSEEQRKTISQGLRFLADMVEQGDFEDAELQTATNIVSFSKEGSAWEDSESTGQRVAFFLYKKQEANFPAGAYDFRTEHYPIRLPQWMQPVEVDQKP